MIFKTGKSLFLAGLFLIASLSYADTTLVVVASDFIKPMTEIAAEFEKATSHTAKLSFGSSGKAFAQIQNDAPFELYFAASEQYPLELEKLGFAVKNSHFTFAIGKLVLWSQTSNFVDDKGDVLKNGTFKNLAIADPSHAPYGIFSVEVMKKLNVFEKIEPLFIQGENIAQTFQFVTTGNAELGFIAFAQVIDTQTGKIGSGSGWLVPENLHSPFNQTAVLLKKGENNPATLALIDFIKSPPALAIIKKYGFGLPTR
ncbi:MAG: molybdate ABC transporter substrate-binding protein [Methylococcaceae bacterium]|nr:molybdate ABC transporter substrate-binding protein [Methylococcaceae bacterium]